MTSRSDHAVLQAPVNLPPVLLRAAEVAGLTPPRAVELALGFQVWTWCLEAGLHGGDEAEYIGRRLDYLVRQAEALRRRESDGG